MFFFFFDNFYKRFFLKQTFEIIFDEAYVSPEVILNDLLQEYLKELLDMNSLYFI